MPGASAHILAVPIYDTLFVSVMRLRRGHSPFLGSKDHFALRLEKIWFSRRRIVWLSSLAISAWRMTQVPLAWGVVIAAAFTAEFLLVSAAIAKIKI